MQLKYSRTFTKDVIVADIGDALILWVKGEFYIVNHPNLQQSLHNGMLNYDNSMSVSEIKSMIEADIEAKENANPITIHHANR